MTNVGFTCAWPTAWYLFKVQYRVKEGIDIHKMKCYKESFLEGD